jgi:Icc-related predicted phosphoesterase
VAKRYWDRIPHNLDVLITHGPPLRILDQVEPDGEHLGCKELRKSVEAEGLRFTYLTMFTEAQEPLKMEPLAS